MTLPDHVDDADFERMATAQANVRAADSQLNAAQLAVRVAEYERAAAHAQLNELHAQLNAQYQLTDGDRVEAGAGHKITRATNG